MNEKTPLEITMERFQTTAEEAFSTDPYLDTVAVVFNWKVGNSDMPFGLMLGRDGVINTPSELIGISQQTCKMLMHQALNLQGMLEAVDQIAAELASKVKKIKEQKDVEDK